MSELKDIQFYTVDSNVLSKISLEDICAQKIYRPEIIDSESGKSNHELKSVEFVFHENSNEFNLFRLFSKLPLKLGDELSLLLTVEAINNFSIDSKIIISLLELLNDLLTSLLTLFGE